MYLVLCTLSFDKIFNMVNNKNSDFVEGIVVGLLKTKHSYRSIQKVVKDLGYSISLGSISNILHKMGLNRSATYKRETRPKPKKRPTVSTPGVIRSIARMIKKTESADPT